MGTGQPLLGIRESKVLTVSPQLLAGNELKLTWKRVWWSLVCSLERDAPW